MHCLQHLQPTKQLNLSTGSYRYRIYRLQRTASKEHSSLAAVLTTMCFHNWKRVAGGCFGYVLGRPPSRLVSYILIYKQLVHKKWDHSAVKVSRTSATATIGLFPLHSRLNTATYCRTQERPRGRHDCSISLFVGGGGSFCFRSYLRHLWLATGRKIVKRPWGILQRVIGGMDFCSPGHWISSFNNSMKHNEIIWNPYRWTCCQLVD